MPCWIFSSYWGTCLWPTISVLWKPYCNTLCSCLFSALFSQLYKPLLLLRPVRCSWLIPEWCLSEKQTLTTHWTPCVVFSYSRCLFPIAASVVFKERGWSQACQSLAIRQYLACWSSVQFFLPHLALALQPDLLVAELFWAKFQTLFQNFRFTVWLSNMSV